MKNRAASTVTVPDDTQTGPDAPKKQGRRGRKKTPPPPSSRKGTDAGLDSRGAKKKAQKVDEDDDDAFDPKNSEPWPPAARIGFSGSDCPAPPPAPLVAGAAAASPADDSEMAAESEAAEAAPSADTSSSSDDDALPSDADLKDMTAKQLRKLMGRRGLARDPQDRKEDFIEKLKAHAAGESRETHRHRA